MRIAHLSDLHLGFKSYNKTNELGINQREADVALAFRHAVDDILSEADVDLVVVAGDIFDSSSPSCAVMQDAIRQFRKLSGKDVVIVAGNHDMPRSASEGHPLRVLKQALPELHVIIDEAELIDLSILNFLDCVVLGVPHGAVHGLGNMVRRADLVKAQQDRTSVLVIHAAIQDHDKKVLYAQMGDHTVNVDVMRPDRWDYIAAGDYHAFTCLAEPNAYYSGSIENVLTGPWADAKIKHGWVLYDTDTKEAQLMVVGTRPVIDLPAVELIAGTPDMLMHTIRAQVEQLSLVGCIVRQVVNNISAELENALDWEWIREMKRRCLHYHLDCRRPAGGEINPAPESGSRETLEESVERFVMEDWEEDPPVARESVRDVALESIQ